MIIQNQNAEQKLKYIKRRLEKRPANASFTQPLPRRTRPLISTSNTINSSSEDVNFSLNQSNNRQTPNSNKRNSAVSKTTESSKTNSCRNEIDGKSILSTELNGADGKSHKNKLKVPRRHRSFNRKFQQSRKSLFFKEFSFHFRQFSLS